MLERGNPLEGLSLPSRIGRIVVTDGGPMVRLVCRGQSFARRDGFDQPILRGLQTGELTNLRLGPDEWLVMAATSAHAAALQTIAALPPECTVVDVSHRQTSIMLEGPSVGDVLNAGCPLDFSLDAFPLGMCTRTIFGKGEIMLWHDKHQRYHLQALRSYMPYVVGLLGEAVRDLP